MMEMRATVNVGTLGHFEYGHLHPWKDGRPNVFEAVACSRERWRMDPGVELRYAHPGEWPAGARHVRFVTVTAGDASSSWLAHTAGELTE